MNLKGKTVLITGASRGIGAASALKLAKNGAAVAINYNNSAEKAHQLVDTIIENGGKAIAVKANIFDQAETEDMVREIHDQLGDIDVLVLNAGASFKVAPFLEQSWNDFETKVLNEIKGSFWALQTVLPSMIERKSGSIIIVSSGSSRRPSAGFSSHTTAKSGLDGFAKALAFEYGPIGIRVNVIAPGLTETDATSFWPQSHKDFVANMIPMKRIGQPDDVAGAVLFYASDESKYLTGNYVPVNGGSIML